MAVMFITYRETCSQASSRTKMMLWGGYLDICFSTSDLRVMKLVSVRRAFLTKAVPRMIGMPALYRPVFPRTHVTSTVDAMAEQQVANASCRGWGYVPQAFLNDLMRCAAKINPCRSSHLQAIAPCSCTPNTILTHLEKISRIRDVTPSYVVQQDRCNFPRKN